MKTLNRKKLTLLTLVVALGVLFAPFCFGIIALFAFIARSTAILAGITLILPGIRVVLVGVAVYFIRAAKPLSGCQSDKFQEFRHGAQRHAVVESLLRPGFGDFFLFLVFHLVLKLVYDVCLVCRQALDLFDLYAVRHE